VAKSNNIHSISVEASTSQLAKVRDFVADHAEKLGLSEKEIGNIRLAVDEAYTNIIKHAYKNIPAKPVDIELGYDGSQLWISIKDEGESFDPGTYSEPDLRQRIKNKQRGGMGVYLIRKLMDNVQYNRHGHTNEIRMIKHL